MGNGLGWRCRRHMTPAALSALPLQDYGHVRLGYEDLFRRKQEQWAHHHHHHHHHHHNTSGPSQSSPIFTVDFGSEVGGRRRRPAF